MAAPIVSRDYVRPDSIAEAVTALRPTNSVPLAGGTHLVGHLPAESVTLVDLQALGLTTVNLAEDGGLTAGAMVTLQQLIDVLSPSITAPGLVRLREATSHEAPRQVRHTATLGGTIAIAAPSSQVLTTLLALDAQLHLADGRTLAVADYDQGLILSVHISARAARAGAGVAQVVRTPMDSPIVCAVATVLIAPDQATIQWVRLAVAADPTHRPTRLPGVEQALLELSLPQAMDQVGALAAAAVTPAGDFRGSAAYRREMIRVLVGRAFGQACSHIEEQQ